jgi:hypothetical protein
VAEATMAEQVLKAIAVAKAVSPESKSMPAKVDHPPQKATPKGGRSLSEEEWPAFELATLAPGQCWLQLIAIFTRIPESHSLAWVTATNLAVVRRSPVYHPRQV